MSCKLVEISSVTEKSEVLKQFLFPSTSPQEKEDDASVSDDWNQDWDWQTEEKNDEQEEDTHSWLQQCCVAVSPTLDIMAIANQNKMVLLTQKWNYESEEGSLGNLDVVWKGCVHQDEGEYVTDIMCLPLASQKRSSQWGPDWVCVIVGLSSGYVRMYTETGALLLSQILHEEPVLKLKCRTYEAPRHSGVAEQHEEVTILYPTAIVTIDGFSLFQSLKACRNRVARATASGNEVIQPPPLAYKKWGLNGQQQIVDHISSGVYTPSIFDQMQTASITDGFNAVIKSSPPALSLYTTVGVGPYLGFYHAVEGTGQPLLSDMAFAVASKLKSALFSKVSVAGGWFGLGGHKPDETKEKTKLKIEPSTPLRIRYGLPDVRRTGESISLSPENNLATICDSFGRITLIDVCYGVAVRMWKGYRDAQVGWMQVKEDQSARVALFLIIYAPKRGIVEVWTAQMGDRVAAFNVGKSCRLVCPGHGIMGLNNITCHSVKSKQFQCYLIDMQGKVKTLQVPFHLSLSDKNSKRARDAHLLKKLKMVLKNTKDSGDYQQTKDILLDMKTASILHQSLERVLLSGVFNCQSLVDIVNSVQDGVLSHSPSLREMERTTSLDLESNMLLQFCKLQLQLLQAYTTINQLIGDTQDIAENICENLPEMFNIPESQAVEVELKLQSYLIDTKSERRVHFQSDTHLGVSSFLSCFHCHTGRIDHEGVSLRPDMGQDKKLMIAEFLFQACLQNSGPCHQLCDVFQELSLPTNHAVSLLTELWLSKDNKLLQGCVGLHQLIKTISQRQDPNHVVEETSLTWWKLVQLRLAQSQNLSAALTLAIVCRGVALECTRNRSQDDTTQEECEWETVSLEVEECNILIKQLEDCLVLSSLFRLDPHKAHNVSVARMLEGGKGVIPELIAKWVALKGLRPEVVYRRGKADSLQDLQVPFDVDEQAVSDKMCILYSQFPRSLNHDALMVNCCWECAVLWNKDVDDNSHFDRALEYLKLVQNAVLQHGICCLMWTTFIVKKLAASAALIEKVGKAPKDRICRRDMGMSETTLVKFLGAVSELLDIFMQANCDASDVPVFSLEELWQHSQGPTSLVDLAVDQSSTNYSLLRHHYQLAVILHAVVTFCLKSVKPLSLFDVKGQRSFFLDLTSHPYFSHDIDLGIVNKRRLFLSRVITEAVCLLPTDDEERQQHTSKHVVTKWFNLVMTVGKDLNVDVECLKRMYVQQLYSSGHDKMAEEVLHIISDHEVMGSQLLLTSGQRMAHFVTRCDPPGSAEILSKISPTLSTWLKSLDSSELRCPNVPLADTAKLVAHTVNQLAEGHSEYKMAISLVELVHSLM